MELAIELFSAAFLPMAVGLAIVAVLINLCEGER